MATQITWSCSFQINVLFPRVLLLRLKYQFKSVICKLYFLAPRFGCVQQLLARSLRVILNGFNLLFLSLLRVLIVAGRRVGITSSWPTLFINEVVLSLSLSIYLGLLIQNVLQRSSTRTIACLE